MVPYSRISVLFVEKKLRLLVTEEEYISQRLTVSDRLAFECPKHPDVVQSSVSYHKLQQGAHGCLACAEKARADKKRIPYAEIKATLKSETMSSLFRRKSIAPA